MVNELMTEDNGQEYKGWGIAVFECGGRYSTLTMVSGNLLSDLRKRLEGEGEARKYGMAYVAGRNGIGDGEIDALSRQACAIANEANERHLDFQQVRDRLRDISLAFD